MSAPTGMWAYPTEVLIGPGTIEKLAEVAQRHGMSRPLFVTDELLQDRDIVKRSMEILTKAQLHAGLYAGIKGNPTESNVNNGIRAFQDGNHDGIVAFGGGSALDAAKTIALMSGHEGGVFDDRDGAQNWMTVTSAVPPIVAVPTTAGTGSEVGRAAVITKEETDEKTIIINPGMMPRTVISDPELTVGLPRHITAATGMDAFVHCFEAYCTPFYHPMSEGIALEGMRLISEYLPKAYDDGADLEARTHMLSAASMGAVAFQKGLGAVHALAHPIGALYDTHHGLTNAVILPYMMVRNRPAIEEKMPLLGRILNLASPTFDGILEWALEFRKRLDIPHTLADIGVPSDKAIVVGEMASRDMTAQTNPIKLSSADFEEVFHKAMKGEI